MTRTASWLFLLLSSITRNCTMSATSASSCSDDLRHFKYHATVHASPESAYGRNESVGRNAQISLPCYLTNRALERQATRTLTRVLFALLRYSRCLLRRARHCRRLCRTHIIPTCCRRCTSCCTSCSTRLSLLHRLLLLCNTAI